MALACALVVLAGCARPTGDFGRAQPNTMHDVWMPAAGNRIARHVRGEPVSDFNGTDQERILRDRAWGLVLPPHTGDWVAENVIELQRTRIISEMDSRFDAKAYYAFLRREQFRSSEVRWARLISDINMDAELVYPFWEQARLVRADDRMRMEAADARRDLDPLELQNATARVDENARVVDWVWRSLRLRVAAYRNAIDRMSVETPSRLGVTAGRALHELELSIAEAEASVGASIGGRGGVAGGTAGFRPSRYADPRLVNGAVPQK